MYLQKMKKNILCFTRSNDVSKVLKSTKKVSHMIWTMSQLMRNNVVIYPAEVIGVNTLKHVIRGLVQYIDGLMQYCSNSIVTAVLH